MNFKPLLNQENQRPLFIGGPCSAETEAQVLETAHRLKAQGVNVYRAGIWKPRTRPNSFEGVGSVGLQWLRKVKEETGMLVTTEVANAQHTYEALKYGVDILWIGARTTVNPFSVQEIADVLKGVDIPVMIKNPINPDLELWIGAIERVYNSGINRIAAIHRGFSNYQKNKYRNTPHWEYPIEMMRRFPELTMICDPSHITGKRDLLQEVAQQAMDLNFDGLIMESHITPDEAWSDAAQQVTPERLREILDSLVIREEKSTDVNFVETIEDLRRKIDHIDNELLNILSERMKVVANIGIYKKNNNISIYQQSRWGEMLQAMVDKGKEKNLSEEFVRLFLSAIHQESINRQAMIMNDLNTEKVTA